MFGTGNVKHCTKCGEGTIKEDRQVCKHCGCEQWEAVPSQADADAANSMMMNEAKAMDSMDGQDESSDEILTGSTEEALARLHEMVQGAASDEERLWQLNGVHLGTFASEGKTMDDVLLAFLQWCQKDEDRAACRFNLSKAMRRLTAFATFQDKHYEQFFDTPVDPSEAEFQKAHKMMALDIPSWTTDTGCALWTLDVKEVDVSEAWSDRAMVRYMWFVMLKSLFDEACCQEGVVIVENIDCGARTFYKLSGATKNTEAVFLEMCYGAMPFKMKKCIITGSPWWMNMMLGVMRMFMSTKMSKRIVNTDMKGLHREVGAHNLPKGVFEGTRDYEHRYQVS